jgi:hypothetical protein
MTTQDDPMWPEFQNLWKGLPTEHNQVLLAGGYGLFLKQQWLMVNSDQPTVIAIRDWRDATLRVTKDMDFLLGLELLASRETQGRIADVMGANRFQPVAGNERWQFEKTLSADHRVIIDWHAKLPEVDNPHLELDKLRVKHKPSLGGRGVHARQNPEAAGCEIHPFDFKLDTLRIVVPNPVTWAVMKVVSADDRWRRSQNAWTVEDREFHRAQAVKHARDALKIGAMTTREEMDRTDDVIAQIRDTPGFIRAQGVWKNDFSHANAWAWQTGSSQWRPEDWEIIRSAMSEWFK